jgi:hypothetical protein
MISLGVKFKKNLQSIFGIVRCFKQINKISLLKAFGLGTEHCQNTIAWGDISEKSSNTALDNPSTSFGRACSIRALK